MILHFVVKGRPVPKPRMSQRDRWEHRPAVARYREYVDSVRAAIIDAKRAAGLGEFAKIDGPVRVLVTFSVDETHVTVAPEDRAGYGRPMGLRGDADNFLKALLEGLHPQRGTLGISILADDDQVVALEAAFRDLGSLTEGTPKPIMGL